MPASFLLIAFRFPPYDRIGAYRWTKLCGRLARLGHSIDVLTVRWKEEKDPGWFQDIRHPNIHIHRTHSLYPHRWRNLRPQHRLAQRLHGRAVRYLDRLLPPHDMASLWGTSLLPAASRLLAAKHIPVVIATGAPFSANLWAARLATRHPALRLIQDFRDPWLDTHAELTTSPWAPKFREATQRANVLVSVTEEMSQLFRELSGHQRVVTIPNGVELAELRKLEAPPKPLFDFAYIGGLYNQREVPFRRFLDWVRKRKREGSAPRTVVAGLYASALPEEFRDLTESGHLELRGFLEQREAFRLILASRFALQFNGPGAFASVQTTTKLVEHAALLRPTLSLNYGGAAEDFIRKRQIGVSLHADSATLFDELDAVRNSDRQFNFDVSDLDFDQTSLRYSRLIDGLAAE